MKKLLLAASVFFCLQSSAQDDLFNLEKPPARNGVVFGFNGGFDIPGGDMAERFGASYRVGAQVFYKTKSNWLFGIKYDYLFGGKIKEDSLMYNIRDKYGSFINNEGRRTGVRLDERAYMVGLQAGKIFNVVKHNSDNGIMVLTTLGFMEHKIFIRDREQTITQLSGSKKKGYDRLTNGLLLEQYVGYVHFSNNNLFNFHVGLNLSAGFTQGRRDFLYDVMRTDNAKRLDLLFGIKAGLYIPVFKKKSEDYYFE